MKDFVTYVLIELLPFWEKLFLLIGALAWPLSLVFSVFLLRGPIKEFIGRIQKLSASGAEILAPITQDEPNPGDINLAGGLQSPTPHAHQNQPMAEIEKRILTELESFPKDNQKQVLLTELAKARLERTYNLAYANIFGSQIKALRTINERGGAIARAEAEELFRELQETIAPLKEWTLDRYVNFLIAYFFVEKTADSFSITEFGRDFLAYLSRVGLSEDRPH